MIWGYPYFRKHPDLFAVSGCLCLTHFEAWKRLAKHFSSRCLGSQNTSGVLSQISEFDIIATITKNISLSRSRHPQWKNWGPEIYESTTWKHQGFVFILWSVWTVLLIFSQWMCNFLEPDESWWGLLKLMIHQPCSVHRESCIIWGFKYLI